MRNSNELYIIARDLDILCNQDNSESETIRASLEKDADKAIKLMARLVAVNQDWSRNLILKLKDKNATFWEPLHRGALKGLLDFSKAPADKTVIDNLTGYLNDPASIPKPFDKGVWIL